MSILSKIASSLEGRLGRPRLSYWRTVWANFRLLPFRQAIKFPIRIYGKVILSCLQGRIEFTHNEGIICIGMQVAGYTAAKPARLAILPGAVWKVGRNVKISQGASIFINRNAIFEIGDNCTMGDDSKLICYRSIKLGHDCDLTWQTQTMDFNSHFIEDSDGNVQQIIKPIELGDYVWVGNRSTIMPGTRIPSWTIIASNSLCNKDYTTLIPSESIIGGTPAKLIRSGLHRIYDRAREQYILQQQFNNPQKINQ